MNKLNFLLIVFCFSVVFGNAQPIKVELKKIENNFQLYRGGKPYYIKGAGGNKYLDKLVSFGGNSIRTWGDEGTQELLDEAHKRGVSVMFGLWMQHERHGFNYDDKDAIKNQLENFKKTILKFKDHPALLMWGIGNEVDLFYTNTNVWYAINDVAKFIHEVDPNHPTTTITAGIDKEEIRLINERCPHIDIYSVNTYGDIKNIPASVREYGWKGAYIVTEWGPNGHWEVSKTPWKAAIEQTSTEKSKVYKERYQEYIEKDVEKCLGSYVFLWGNKQETTPTWYGLFLSTGEETEVLNVLQYVWSGKWPKNLSPDIQSFTVNEKSAFDNVYLKSNSINTALVNSSDPDKDPITYRWEILPESTDIKSGGDKEEKPEAINGLFVKEKHGTLSFKAPSEEGAYRIFIYVKDAHNHVATANIPFYVVK